MTSLNEDVRVALKEALEVLPDVSVYAYPQFGSSVPRVTIAASQQGYIEYSQTMDGIGVALVRFEVWVECVAADDVSPQKVLDGYLSPDPTNPDSIPMALGVDKTLGQLVSDVRCVAARVLQITPEGPQVAVVDVEVLLSDRG